MKKAIALGVLVFASLMSTSAFAGCDENDIDTVSSDGEIIELIDGTIWRSDDPATSASWLSSETVLLCDDSVMINKDEGGEQVDVTQE